MRPVQAEATSGRTGRQWVEGGKRGGGCHLEHGGDGGDGGDGGVVQSEVHVNLLEQGEPNDLPAVVDGSMRGGGQAGRVVKSQGRLGGGLREHYNPGTNLVLPPSGRDDAVHGTDQDLRQHGYTGTVSSVRQHTNHTASSTT